MPQTQPRFESVEPIMPADFLKWQCKTRRDLFESLLRGEYPRFLQSHLPVVSTSNGPEAAFPIRSSNKGVGLLPIASELERYVLELEDCLERTRELPPKETLEERIEVVRKLYDRPEYVDRRLFGTIEIFHGQTYRNLLRDSRASLLFTGLGPRYMSYQLDCHVEMIAEGNMHFRFIRAMRTLFERDRFHIQQPPHMLGYLFTLAEAIDKTPKPVRRSRATQCPMGHG